MRLCLIVSIPLVLSTTGCSAWLKHSGKDISRLKTQEEVHAALGIPVAISLEDGQRCEHYHTHRKICDTPLGDYTGLECILTLGLSEFVYLPPAVYDTSRDLIRGRDIDVIYDSKGNITSMHGVFFIKDPGSVPTKEPIPDANDILPAAP